MRWRVLIEKTAEDDLAWFRRHDRRLYSKCFDLIRDLIDDPREGIGKPERLRHQSRDVWSRRVSDEHRLVYWLESASNTVIVTSCRSHYGDR